MANETNPCHCDCATPLVGWKPRCRLCNRMITRTDVEIPPMKPQPNLSAAVQTLEEAQQEGDAATGDRNLQLDILREAVREALSRLRQREDTTP